MYTAHTQYLSISQSDFYVISPIGATHCTDGGEFGMDEWVKGGLLHSSFTFIGAPLGMCGPKNFRTFQHLWKQHGQL